MKKPHAWLPVALSLGILAMLAITFITSGLVREADEGVEAHIFQLWLVVEIILIGSLAIKWLPRVPRQAFLILAVQVIAVLLPCVVVFYFNL